MKPPYMVTLKCKHTIPCYYSYTIIESLEYLHCRSCKTLVQITGVYGVKP